MLVSAVALAAQAGFAAVFCPIGILFRAAVV
jgi:hypothetical protein